jgi:nudix-type nucleoside diphosphatase (YffH/AdpP family)
MPVELRKVETVYQGYSTLLKATMVGPDGETFVREIEHHGRAAAVLPYDPERRVALLVSLPRAPVIWAGGPPELAEAPAGMVDDEDAEDTARREALEEAGVKLGRLDSLGAPFASPGVSAERVDLFLAAYAATDRVADGGGVDGEQEHITVMEVPLDQLWSWVEKRRIEDMKTLLLVLALRVRRPELFGA